MKKLFAIPALLVLNCLFVSDPPATGSTEENWKKVEKAMEKGLPKTAIKHLKPIIEQAVERKDYAEAVKAIGHRIVLEASIEGNKPEEKITRLQAEIKKAPPEMKPVMEAILAHWYWQYFQRNRWRFMRRTRTAEPPGEDFTTWDLPRLFAEISKHFEKALSAAPALKETPVSRYQELLVKGNMPDKYRPTLYDFIAHQALSFYSSGEQAAARPEDAFDLRASSPIFSPAKQFVGWEIETTLKDLPVVKALRLYQDLLSFHSGDKEPSAWLHANLLRLNFGYNKAAGEEKNARYKAALKRFSEKNASHPLSALALYRLARTLRAEEQLVKAHQAASRGKSRFPESPGGKKCHNLIQKIEQESIRITTERVWNEPFGTINIFYRNVTKVYFRIVPYDWKKWVKTRKRDRRDLLQREPVLTWSVELPPTRDYKEDLKEIPAREDLKPGSYFLIASCREDFGKEDNQVHFTPFWFSDLALVIRPRRGEKTLEGFVLDAKSGLPVTGAEVQLWQLSRGNRWTQHDSGKTDENGLFRFEEGPIHQRLRIHASSGRRVLATERSYYVHESRRKHRPFERTVFFTDRSLYRPGQTIRYKGICIHVNQNKDNYRVIKNRSLSVIFSDRNGKEVARQKHRTNDYGSFSGSFTAPRKRLMGRMTIRVEGDPRGACHFNVEQYKRPKFKVTLNPPQQPARLKREVKLKGSAKAYTGASINGAKVRWRVVREVRYPPWWGWFYWWRSPQTESQEIAHGTTTTHGDGSFTVKFPAKPDPSVLEKEEPTFRFKVNAEVTDPTGETRTAQRVINAGYTALKASLSADDWQTVDRPVEISVRTASLDGEGRRAEGVIKIHRLKQPEKVMRRRLHGARYGPVRSRNARGHKKDLSNPHSWPLGELAAERGFTTDPAGNAKYTFKLDSGPYRVLLETNDRFGKAVTARLPLRVVDPDATAFNIKVPDSLEAPSWSVEPGEEFKAVWGSGYSKARAYVEIEHRRKILQRYWTGPGRTQVEIKQKVTEEMRGGFTLRVTFVRENRAYLHSRRVSVPWTNKNLSIRWEHFTSKLKPAAEETWTAVITGPDAEKAVAEMVAALYDASLDAYKPHSWPNHFGVFRHDSSNLRSHFENRLRGLSRLHGRWDMDSKNVRMEYRRYPEIIRQSFRRFAFPGKGRGVRLGRSGAPGAELKGKATSDAVLESAAPRKTPATLTGGKKQAAGKGKPAEEPADTPDLSKVSARKNLNETAFFFPHLTSNKKGEVRLEFTMPEALTEWNLFAFAHDAELRAGFLKDKVVTSKDLMVQPNPPRFLREGDVLDFTVKVSNQSPAHQKGKVRLTFEEARTGENADKALGNSENTLSFDVPSKQSRTYSWKLRVPDGMGFLKYKAVGSTGRLSDGEEGYLPVLPRRILVTESMPLPIRGEKTKHFKFDRLLNSEKSETLEHKTLTLQMTSNPAWYAVMALPYLMEYPHQCTEQVFNRLYANSLARHIANSHPKIRRVFEQWKATPALESPLEKNEDLKNVMLQETPWLKQAKKESQARKRIGVLFDDNRLNREIGRALEQLSEMQLSNGAWPWFPGGRANDYMTLYITTGFGRLRHLGVDIEVSLAKKALGRLDAWIHRTYRHILKHGDPEKNHLSPQVALYLYGRSFFLEDKSIDPKNREAVDYFLAQAKKYWLKLASRQSQAHLAVALKRFGNTQTPADIMRSIKERSVRDEELGMFWRELERSWWWYRAPIETQAMMIEAFDEVMDDQKAVEACKVWLLKQKQTQNWKTTKATADVVYALLLRGSDLLASDQLVKVTLGERTVEPEKVEAGTGYYEERFVESAIKPSFGRVTVKKLDEGVAWGSLNWQYLEDMSKVSAYEGTPLKLQKKLYTREYTGKGPVLKPVEGPLEVGDELVVRIVLRVDRDMEYVHLKDSRGSGTEPVSVLSKYKSQDGLFYYESTHDTATHFFIDYLPKGTYVFEYGNRVVHKGRYQTGVAKIQCMYAPEFNSHSESFVLEVK